MAAENIRATAGVDFNQRTQSVSLAKRADSWVAKQISSVPPF
jgi:hypothetical protein